MKRINKKIFVFFATGIIISGIFFTNYAEALVNPVGRLYYGNVTNTVLNFRTNTYDFGFGAAQTFTHGASASLIRFVVAKPAVTRDEIMVGALKADGQLMVIKGINGYDINTDYSLAWSNTGTGPAMTCEGTKADCTRSFDIAYERLSGRAMVVYADNVNQKLYYCYWNGSAWGPVSNCAPTNGTNDITLFSNGRPTYVSLKPKDGSNEIIMGVSLDVSSVMEVEAYRWTGSAWTDGVLLTGAVTVSAQGRDQGAIFDLDWESTTGDAVVVYATTEANEIKYRRLVSGSGSWDAEANAFDTPVNGSGVIWVNTEGDPSSNRIAVATNDTANDLSVAVWKADGTTAGWTDFSATINELTLEGGAGTTAGPAYTDLLWKEFGSEFIVVAQNAGAGDTGEYTRLTCTGTGCTVTTAITVITTTAGTDDAQFNRLAGSRNSDDIMYIQSDIDNNLFLQHWNGTAWEAGDSGVMNASASICSADNIATGCVDMPAVFTYLRYSPWSRNWRWYAGTDTTDTPTTALATENATSTGIDGYNQQLRLRFNVAETGGQGQTDARKKLQYTTTNPYAETASWTDVDNSAGADIWRYFDCNGGTATCNDGQTTAANVLTGSTGTGWWTGSKDAAGGTSMDHATSTTREIEFPIKGNNTATGTTYYFRMYDVDQDSAVRRFQDSGNTASCAGSTGCEYPELKTATSTYNQEAFRFFANVVDSTDVGAALAAQDTAASLTSTGQAFRLRILNHVAVAGLGANQGDFKLQFAAKGVGTCTAPTGSYTDVTTGTAISFNDNATPTDGSALTANASDPDAGHTVVVQSYEELNNFTNPNAIPSGQDGKWDFSLYDNAAPGATDYCFRMVATNSSNNSTITYTQYPQITTIASQPAINQLHYRWRNDDGNEIGTSFAAATNTALTNGIYIGDRMRLRFLISNSTASADNYTYRLEHASTSCTTWLPVPSPATTQHWEMDVSGNVLNDSVTTDFSPGITNPNGKTFVSGFIKTASNQTSAITLGSSNFTELEYSVRSVFNVTVGTNYCFRVTNAGNGTNFTYTQIPQITVTGIRTNSGGGGAGGGEQSGSGASQGGGGASGGGGGEEPGGGGAPTGGGTPGGGGGDSGYLYIKSNLASIGTLEIGGFVKHLLVFLWR